MERSGSIPAIPPEERGFSREQHARLSVLIIFLWIVLVLVLALRLGVLCAQTHTGISINVASDGTCEAAGLHVSCRDIGRKLREAGIPLDTWISFRGAVSVRYDAMKPTIDSLTSAGFKNIKIGFITEPAH